MAEDVSLQAEPFWDRGAPYEAPHGYSRGTGEFVAGKVATSIQFKMRPGDQCIARGVMLMTDGKVYIWTVRAEGHDDNGHRRLATLMRGGTFTETAHSLFLTEEDRIDPDLIDFYRKQVDAL